MVGFLVLAAVIGVFGVAQAKPPVDSVVSGVVTLGPTCPVQQQGDPGCEDQPYSTTIEIYRSNNLNNPTETVVSDSSGAYSVELGSGSYVVRALGGPGTYPSCEDIAVTVVDGVNLQVDIACSTGLY